MTIADRVQNGINFLDKERPGWYDAIDLDQLNMTHTYLCIVGQVYGDRDPTFTLFSFYKIIGDYKNAVEMGFDTGGTDEAYSELENEWKNRITQIREANHADPV